MKNRQLSKIQLVIPYLLKLVSLFCLLFALLLAVLQIIPNRNFTIPPTNPNIIAEPKIQIEPQPILFDDVTLTSGINHSHIQHSGTINDIRDGLNAGACVADFDGDGWVDLLFAAGGGQTRYYGRQSWWNNHYPAIIYHNQSGFFKRLPNATIDVSSSITACAAYDLDNDGLTDVLLASTEGVVLFRNAGNLKFERKENFSQLVKPAWVSHITVSDINQDGLPDIHLSTFIRYQKNIKSLELATGFSEQHQHQFDPQSFDGMDNVFLLNQGKLNFIDKTQEYGLAGRQERTVSANALDIDGDGTVELLELNSSDQSVRSYFINDNKLNLIERNSWPLTINNTHYVDSGQQLGDANPLLFFSRGAGLANIALIANADIKTGQDIIWPTQLMQHNNIFLNYWGSVFADFNNDSRVDLVMATGGLMADSFSKQMTQASPNVCATQIPNNTTSPVFTTHSCNSAITSSRSVVRLDYNNDGRMDLLFVNNNDFPQLMVNHSSDSGNWISLDIPSDSKWYAAQLSIGDNGVIHIMPPANRTALFGNHDPRQHFGLASLQNTTVTLSKAKNTLQQELSVNHFYRLEGDKWVIKDIFPTPLNRIELAQGDIASQVRMLFGQSITELQYEVLGKILQQASSEQMAELANLISQYPSNPHIALYLQWLSAASPILQTAAADAILQLESEISVRYLLAHLASDDSVLYCLVAGVFAQWFEQEEAVTRAKYLAIPYLMQRLTSQSSEIVSCTAKALGYAEHQNSTSAILAIIENAPENAKADLINALGKIRQKEAIAYLHQQVQVSKNIAVIQQSIIALVRLNDLHLDRLVQTLAAPSKQSTYVFVALYALPNAIDNVVIDSQKRKEWLQSWPMQLKVSQLESDYLRELYMGAADNQEIPFETLSKLNRSDSPRLASLILQQRLMRVLDRSNLLLISAQNLNEASLKILEKKLLTLPASVNLENVNLLQLSNLVVFLPLFSAEQQSQILRQAANRQSLHFTPQQSNTFLSVLLRYGDKLTLQSRGNINNLGWLEWLVFAQSNDTSLGQLGKLIDQAFANRKPFFLTNWLQINTFEWQFIMPKRVSAALLFQSNLDDELKLNWAIKYFAMDNYSKTWLLTKINDGDEASLNACLSANGFDWLISKVDVASLLSNVSYTLSTKNRLRSFVQMADHNLTKVGS
jgi:hypothetical protein